MAGTVASARIVDTFSPKVSFDCLGVKCDRPIRRVIWENRRSQSVKILHILRIFLPKKKVNSIHTALPAAMRYILKSESFDRRGEGEKLYCIIAGSAVKNKKRFSKLLIFVENFQKCQFLLK